MNEDTKNALIKFSKAIAKTAITAGVALITSLCAQCGI